ncbi:MAG: hypothetical protein AAGG48_17540 [Planctomycetota bacterium]
MADEKGEILEERLQHLIDAKSLRLGPRFMEKMPPTVVEQFADDFQNALDEIAIAWVTGHISHDVAQERVDELGGVDPKLIRASGKLHSAINAANRSWLDRAVERRESLKIHDPDDESTDQPSRDR